MGVYLKKTASGDFRPCFFGSYTLNGKRIDNIRLNEWKGTPPASGKASDCIKGDGDILFLQSYFEATTNLERYKKERSETPTESEMSRLIEKRNEIEEQIYNIDHPVILDSLWNDYKEKVGSFKCSPETQKNYEAYTNRFALFVSKRHNEGLALPLYFVTYEDVLAFLQMIEDEGYKNRTWNEYLAHIKRIFRVLYPKTGIYEKLSILGFRTKDCTLHRIFEKHEIDKIIQTAKELAQKDSSFSLIYSMVIIASFTGLRLKDIRFLKWNSIDFEKGKISLTTFKNKGSATLGMWSPLETELRRLRQTADASSEFVLPEATTRSKSYLTDQLKRVLALAGVISAPEGLSAPRVASELPQELFEAVSVAINNSKLSIKRKQKALSILTEYILNDCTVDDIALKLGISKGSVSGYLNDATRLSGKQIIPSSVSLSDTVEKKDSSLDTETENEIIGWHSFRGSFVTMAIKAGVPMELLKKLLGSSLVEVIRKHYFQPKDDFINEFKDKDPYKV
ncbi:MAG: site-specific integrase [Verrucomicrobia bacterium]|nr:site-specific integrase [Verrucomicrobiota bacterium]